MKSFNEVFLALVTTYVVCIGIMTFSLYMYLHTSIWNGLMLYLINELVKIMNKWMSLIFCGSASILIDMDV